MFVMNKVVPDPSFSETDMSEGIVTLSDSHYYPGLETLYLSVQECYPLPVTCYDIGLTPAQIEHAAKYYPSLTILPLPADPQIERVRTTFEQSEPLDKIGKRVWPLWICPFLISLSGYRRVFWLDTDLVVLRNLDQLFEKLDQGPVFTVENNAPDKTPNLPELYQLLPIGREFDLRYPAANGGVSGWDLARDKKVLADYMLPILSACDNIEIREAISWHDQGALIWAIQKNALEHRVETETRWNLCVKNSAAGAKTYNWGPDVLSKLRHDEPDACILHWNGHRVPWLS